MKVSTAKVWLKSENVKNGDKIIILDEGQFVTSAKYTYADGTPRKDFILKVKHNDQELDLRINATNKKALIKAFGEETADWVGKPCKLDKVNVMVSGKLMDSIIITPMSDAKTTEYEA